jgi:hypothetical protein
MAEIGAPIEGAPGPMSNEQLIEHCAQLTAELQRRELASEPPQPDQAAVCRALFDVAEATQRALIANNCPGV